MDSSGNKTVRDIKNHLLFEVATEVAHRGEFCPHSVSHFVAKPRDREGYWLESLEFLHSKPR